MALEISPLLWRGFRSYTRATDAGLLQIFRVVGLNRIPNNGAVGAGGFSKRKS